jgi:hypothetical protein
MNDLIGGCFEENVLAGEHHKDIRKKILQFETELARCPGAVFGNDACPLKHTFVNGIYVREITMPKGMLLTSKIHKTEHPFFVLSGECSVLTEDKIVRIRAPYWGITKPGTKRILYMHEDTVWITVHATKLTTPEEVEEEIIAKDFSEIPPELTSKEELCLS